MHRFRLFWDKQRYLNPTVWKEKYILKRHFQAYINSKMAEKADDLFLEKVIIALVIIITAVLLINQLQFFSISHDFFYNIISFLLILSAAILIGWFFLSKTREHHPIKDKEVHDSHPAVKHLRSLSFHEKVSYGIVAFISVLIIFNQLQISQVNALISGAPAPGARLVRSLSTNLNPLGSEGGSKKIIGPQLNPDGRTTKLVEWPTISESSPKKSTGDITQDAIANVVPLGTPPYVLQGPGSEKLAGISFDDPITSQKAWASLLGSKRFGTTNAIQLTPEEDKRWKKLTNSFTCDYCCGGPNSVTTISHCGCAHSYAWQGMAKFFVKNYPDYSDEQIQGEMTKWKALWYPQGMIQDYLVYTGQQPPSILNHGGAAGIKQQFLQQGSNSQQQTKAEATPLKDLPSMVGGC